MTVQTISNMMSSLCFGSKEANPNIICYADQFLLGLNKFEGLFTQSEIAAQPQSTTSPEDEDTRGMNQMKLTMIPILHQLGEKVNIYVGSDSLEKTLLSSKSVGNVGSPVTGRTLYRLARDVLCNCKKLQALVTASNSPYKDGSFPSGANWDDYILWCLTAMNGEDHEQGGGGSSTTAGGVLSPSEQAMSPEEEEESYRNHDDIVGAADVVGADLKSTATTNKYVFKGFLSWCLWGHIPFDNGRSSNHFKSLLFTDMKAGTKVESGSVLSRKALKEAAKAAAAAAAAAVPEGELLNGVILDNRRGVKRQKKTGDLVGGGQQRGRDSIVFDDADSVTLTTLDTSNDALIRQALQYLDSESLEKARQKQSLMDVQNVRDDMRALSGRILSLTRRLNNAAKGSKEEEELTERIDRTEDDLHEREDYLRYLQKKESDRQKEVIATRAQEQLRASSMRDSSSGAPALLLDPLTRTTTPVRGGGGGRRGHVDDMMIFIDDDNCNRVIEFPTPPYARSPAEALLAVAAAPSLVCIDCKIIPTTHTCRRCKQFVCDLCCSTKRDLEMIWWCADCFDAESLTNQRIIRDGMYQSDGDDNETDN